MNIHILICSFINLCIYFVQVKHMLMPYMPMLVPPKKWKGYGTWNGSYQYLMLKCMQWLDLMRLGMIYCAMFKPFSKLE